MAPKKKPAQGTGGHKRTPTSAFDSAAGKDVYEPEKVIAHRVGNCVEAKGCRRLARHAHG